MKHAGVAGFAAMGAMALSLSPSAAVSPHLKKNITVFHLNPLSKIGDGSPADMDTADAAGDIFFALWEAYLYPLACPEGEKTPEDYCKNAENHAKDLVVTKVNLAVNPDWGDYALCNLCVHGEDPYGGPCKTGTYVCDGGDNCTVGRENTMEEFQDGYDDDCDDSFNEHWDCWKAKAAYKLTDAHPGYWYSTLAGARCDAKEDARPAGQCRDLENYDVLLKQKGSKSLHTSTPEKCCELCGSDLPTGMKNCSGWSYSDWSSQVDKNCMLSPYKPESFDCDGDGYGGPVPCAWDVIKVEKSVDFHCHSDSFLGDVEKAGTLKDQECFRKCGGVPGESRNVTSPCWIKCFYGAILGPKQNSATADVTGIPITKLIEFWEKPLYHNFTKCPNMLNTTTTTTTTTTSTTTHR